MASQILAAVRALAVLTVLLGLAYPLAITGVAQVAFNGNADGSLVERDGKVVGSDLIGQSYGDDATYFHGRPSAADYDPTASGATNLGPENDELIAAIEERRAAVGDHAPPDALLASGSGLDPHISPTYAELQVARVARERGLDEGVVRDLVEENTQGRTLGFLGEPRVNVLKLNLALDELSD
ncbi:potassium-transporting ATPase subunit KdpC [Nocardioides speluncae]|uniref:potassium-transporting ATPase subunit KdpC n=1 Tax=Nocardioides speluncae TaxID=2670337 RepID=UPI000D690B5B|nr:potassium-transporting ATPase subunit KdpC [Nocardioides speluncae]